MRSRSGTRDTRRERRRTRSTSSSESADFSDGRSRSPRRDNEDLPPPGTICKNTVKESATTKSTKKKPEDLQREFRSAKRKAEAAEGMLANAEKENLSTSIVAALRYEAQNLRAEAEQKRPCQDKYNVCVQTVENLSKKGSRKKNELIETEKKHESLAAELEKNKEKQTSIQEELDGVRNELRRAELARAACVIETLNECAAEAVEEGSNTFQKTLEDTIKTLGEASDKTSQSEDGAETLGELAESTDSAWKLIKGIRTVGKSKASTKSTWAEVAGASNGSVKKEMEVDPKRGTRRPLEANERASETSTRAKR